MTSLGEQFFVQEAISKVNTTDIDINNGSLFSAMWKNINLINK